MLCERLMTSLKKELRSNSRGLKRPNPFSSAMEIDIEVFDAIFRPHFNDRWSKRLFGKEDFPAAFFPKTFWVSSDFFSRNYHLPIQGVTCLAERLDELVIGLRCYISLDKVKQNYFSIFKIKICQELKFTCNTCCITHKILRIRSLASPPSDAKLPDSNPFEGIIFCMQCRNPFRTVSVSGRPGMQSSGTVPGITGAGSAPVGVVEPDPALDGENMASFSLRRRVPTSH